MLAAATHGETGQHMHQLDLHDLPAGTYCCKISTKSATKTERFVKEQPCTTALAPARH